MKQEIIDILRITLSHETNLTEKDYEFTAEQISQLLCKDISQLARESKNRDLLTAKLEAEILTIKNRVEHHTICEQCGRKSRLITPERAFGKTFRMTYENPENQPCCVGTYCSMGDEKSMICKSCLQALQLQENK
tara:strand:- start:600 stop:1004 length:405 start_codon:yes stop_codon:yes gene_type:complete